MGLVLIVWFEILEVFVKSIFLFGPSYFINVGTKKWLVRK
ncbi:hypothetical protein N481_07320 [Pseudoalteromonas luteoviolacea S4047-1]|uniref:Uncharacterized protein n=1 Tax=Pseudoalteromonas luteoviolacea S4054 TaxID=1129367 RepID=A0A0F6ADH4_9GAMM|nr:hypothetical protein N479_10095 [Pseudoalteromonas luteoviolacea S4054]KZN76155.1 hypothetical protein N481_07320 [Pseudoalteromonas luteoviolacea S4047-1]